MAGTPQIFGLSTNEIIPQSNFIANGNEEGRMTATQDFLVRRDYLESFIGQQRFREGTLATQLDTGLSSFWSFLKLTHTSARNEQGGWMMLTANYTGFWSATYDANTSGERPTTYTMSGTLEEASILEHPKVVALADIERALLAALIDNIATWDIANSKIGSTDPETGEFTNWSDQNLTTTNGVIFADLIAKGVTTYKRPSFTWTKNQESDSPLAAADLSGLGKIDTPDGSPPTPTGSRDWMLVSTDSVQHGTTDPTYTNTITWLLSDREGWDSDLYS